MTWASFNNLTVLKKPNPKPKTNRQIDPISIYHGQNYGLKNYIKYHELITTKFNFFKADTAKEIFDSCQR